MFAPSNCARSSSKSSVSSYRCLLRHSLGRFEKHFKSIGKPSGKLWGYVTGIVLEPGASFVGCPGSRCLKCRVVFHYNPPCPVQIQGTFWGKGKSWGHPKPRQGGFAPCTPLPNARGWYYWRWVQRNCGGHGGDDGRGDCVR